MQALLGMLVSGGRQVTVVNFKCQGQCHMTTQQFLSPQVPSTPTELGRSMGEAPKLAIAGQVECTSATKPS